MTYVETINYLYNKLPMFSRMGSAAYKKDLTNTIALCKALGNPQKDFKSIHVAGTNGKGSVSHSLAAMFQTSGYKTGLYTSPHLYDFRERIRLNGEMIEAEFVTQFVEDIKQLIENIEPSFFEITVAMAFRYFAKQKVDIAIIEVGLGGRLDSTNIITPELSIITNIGWDHMNLLGNTLQKIAFEKAGIIKKNIPVVIGETLPETKNVFEDIAKKKSAPIYFAEDFFKVRDLEMSEEQLSISYKEKNGAVQKIMTDLTGIYQVKNVQTVLTALTILKKSGWKLKDENVHQALLSVKKKTGLYGRWDVIHKQPTVILEVAHNTDGIEQMLQHVQQLNFQQLHIIIGMVKDKEIEQVLAVLPKPALYYFTEAHIPRALPASELKNRALILNLIGNDFPDVNLALQKALHKAAANDLIIVCGSIFLIAEVDKQLLA